MSAPKRSHEEDEDLNMGVYPKPPSSSTVPNIPHSHEEARVLKIPRTDSDRRSPLHSVYRMPSSSSTDLQLDHPDNRLESSKDPNAKEIDDNKDMKCDKDTLNDGFGAASTSHLNPKEPKDIQRGMSHSEAPESRPILSTNIQVLPEVAKEGSATEEKEAHETVGENKVDIKGDDKSKDKDRKHKDLKHRDWVEREKERADRRIIQVGHSKTEFKELVKEDREADRWEREKKETSKEKDRIKDREKDYIKRELWNGAEKEGFNGDKDTADKSIRVPEQETSTMELKKQKEYDALRNIDREGKDRRKERDADVEGDRPEKRSRFSDKEPEDGSLDGEGVLEREREREVFNHGVQQRKRMLRPRGSPQVMNREPRFRSRAQDNEGSQGKVEVSSVVYKIGECMQELIKLWKEYDPSQADKNGESSQGGPTLEIHIPAEHVTATNRQVRGGQLWGTDIYTDDSDLVAVLMHTGYCRPTASPPPPAIQELRATIRVLPPQDGYISTLRNNVRSRAWGAAIGCSYRVERCCILKKGGGAIDLEPCLTHTSAVEPTLAPLAVERSMTTRAAASNALRQQRFIREVTIQYNLCNEPWTKYSISIVADKGLKKPLYTSARLKKGEVLYLETHSCRYELCFTGEKVVKATSASQVHEAEPQNIERDNIMIDVFRWSCCKKPLPQNLMRSVGIPLPQEYVEVLEENLDWEDVQWSQTGVWIAGKEYVLARVHFLPPN